MNGSGGNQNDVSNDQSMDSSFSVSSPPFDPESPPKLMMGAMGCSERNPAFAAARLFESPSDLEGEDDSVEFRIPLKGREDDTEARAFRPLDLNSVLDRGDNGSTGSNMSVSSYESRSKAQPSKAARRRKRQADFPLFGRDMSFGETDLDEEEVPMQFTPRKRSPYRSPCPRTRASPYKSPSSFRTMDGRTVVSKNPFSPMNTDAPAIKTFAPVFDSLTFPVSLDDGRCGIDGSKGTPTKGGGAFSTPFLPRRLSRRTSPIAASPKQFSMSPRKKIPSRQANSQFSVAAASVKSREAPTSTVRKLRRFNSKDDVGAVYENLLMNHQPSLEVETLDGPVGSDGAPEARVSPTDVMCFDTASPPVEKETNFYSKSNASPRGSYTPVRRSLVPHTPMPDRRRKPVKSFFTDDEGGDENEEDANPKSNPVQTTSRFHSDFDVIKNLGSGSFGEVMQVLSRLDGCMYAVKTAHRTARGKADKERMLKEVYALAALSDQADTATFHIVRYHQAWMEDSRLYIQTELCTHTLEDEMKDLSIRTEARQLKLLREMLLALEFIHRNSMVHLDLKPVNIFVKNDRFKLGDFGLVSKISFHEDVEEGDSRYMSRDLLSGNHQDLTKSDIFSLGITMYEVIKGDGKPLPSNGEEWQALRSAHIVWPSNVPSHLRVIIQQMMNPVCDSRPSAKELLLRPHLLSDEQKALNKSLQEVQQAKLELVAQQRELKLFASMPKRKPTLSRSTTWA